MSLLRNAIVTIYSQVVHQPSGIRRFWFGVSLLFLGNAFTGERILQRPTPRHLWATDRPRMCYPTCQQMPWHPAHGHTCDVASPTKNPIVKVAVDVKETQATEKTIEGDMVVEGSCKFTQHIERAHILCTRATCVLSRSKARPHASYYLQY